jgi:integrase
MSRTTLRRSSWRRTKSGTWPCSLGERGCRVRLFEKRKDAGFYREVHHRLTGRDQKSLATRDRDEAERLGKALLARLLTGRRPAIERVPGPVRLDELWRRYSTECPTYLDNKPHSRANATCRAPVLLAYFGAARDIRGLAAADVAAYTKARRAGGIAVDTERMTKPVRQRSVHADLALLRTALRWACTVRELDGLPWLNRNPLEGLRFERERNPVRPVASFEQFEATRAGLRRLAAAPGSTSSLRERWTRVELALVLAEGTGRRRGSIVALSWDDIDFIAGMIRWRAEHDKKGHEWLVPAPAPLLEELRDFHQRLGAPDGRLFPSVRHPKQPIPPAMLSQWLAVAEDAGQVPKLVGGLWHPYRRKWASERMHMPLKAVADAGGWKDTATLLTCYQHTDDAMLLAVMSVPTKRSDRPLTNTNSGETAPQTAPQPGRTTPRIT